MVACFRSPAGLGRNGLASSSHDHRAVARRADNHPSDSAPLAVAKSERRLRLRFAAGTTEGIASASRIESPSQGKGPDERFSPTVLLL